MTLWDYVVRAVSAVVPDDIWEPDDDETIRYLRWHRAAAEHEATRLARVIERAVGHGPPGAYTEAQKRWKR